MFDWKRLHPETRDGEALIGYLNFEIFEKCRWRTKRRGEQALGPGGVPVNVGDVKPIFVQRSELREAGFDVEADPTILSSRFEEIVFFKWRDSEEES